MKTELKFIEDSNNGDFLFCKDISESFCRHGLAKYADFGDANIVFFVFSNNKPRHRQFFVFEYSERRGYWCIETSMEGFVSPWDYGLDEHLTAKFRNDIPVYGWIEYE